MKASTLNPDRSLVDLSFCSFLFWWRGQPCTVMIFRQGSVSNMGVSDNWGGTLFWGPYSRDPTIYGAILLGSPIFGNSHISGPYLLESGFGNVIPIKYP